MVSFVIENRGEECYFAVLLTVTGDIVLRGPNCADLLTCINSIDLIRANATDFSKYELTDSHQWKYFFELKGSDGKAIARSVLFENEADVCASIEFVRRNIPSVRVENYTYLV